MNQHKFLNPTFLSNMLRIFLTLVFIAYISFWVEVNPAYSQEKLNQGITVTPEIVKIIQGEINQANNFFELRLKEEFLDQENKITSLIQEKVATENIFKDISLQHFNTVKHIFDETRNSFNNLIWAITILTAISAFTIATIVGREIKDSRQVKDDIKSEVQEAQKLRGTLEGELMKIEELEKEIKEKDKELNELLELRRSLKSKEIVWVFEDKDKQDFEIVKDLKKNGFENISEYSIGKIVSAFNQSGVNKCDCMIYSLSESSSIQGLKIVLSSLNSMKQKPPLLIYTFNGGNKITIVNDQLTELDNYRNYSISTTPGNFKSLFNGLILGITI